MADAVTDSGKGSLRRTVFVNRKVDHLDHEVGDTGPSGIAECYSAKRRFVWQNVVMAQTRKKKNGLKTKEQRRAEIVNATIQLLTKYGLHGTTISRIAAAAKISRGTLYYHFQNREELIEAALDAMDESRTSWIPEATNGDVPAHLLAIADAHSQWGLNSSSTRVRVFFQLISSGSKDQMVSHVCANVQENLQYLIERVEEGKREGTIASDVDAREVAWSLFLHAWGEDIARFMGADEYIDDGVSRSIFHRLLSTFVAKSSATTEDHLT